MKIRTKLILWLLLLATIVSGAFSVRNFLGERSRLLEQMNEQATAAVKRMENVLPQALYNFDNAQVEKTLEVEMYDANITALLVTDKSNKVVAGKKRGADGRSVTIQAPPDVQPSLSQAIVYRDANSSEELGSVSIYLDDSLVRRRIAHTAWSSAVQALVLDLSFLILVFILVQRLVTRPVTEMMAALDRLACGELTVRSSFRSHDEIGTMGATLDKTAVSLQQAIAAIARNSETLAGAASQIFDAIQHLLHNTEETSSEVRSVSEVSEQVKSRLDEIAGAATDMVNTIREISSSSAAAAGVANDGVASVSMVRETVQQLGESSGEIGKVLQLISEIAQQTNLLALNATIEAARAGEAGKGFAVVANEVKELAKQTALATEEISGKVERIRLQTDAAIEAISSLAALITKINDISMTIAGAVEEQNATTAEISRSIVEAAQGGGAISASINAVSSVATNTAARAGDIRNSAKELETMASSLRELVEKFQY